MMSRKTNQFTKHNRLTSVELLSNDRREVALGSSQLRPRNANIRGRREQSGGQAMDGGGGWGG